MASHPMAWMLMTTIVFLSTIDVTDSAKYTFNMKIKYFSNGYLTCDHPMLNITERNDVESLHWIFEDGSLVTPKKTYLNRRSYILEGLPVGQSASSLPLSKYDGYNLTVLDVDDDVFGYYTCVVLFSNSADQLAVIRYGLNVDGADFSDLIEDYKHNAIIGGIAAGAVLVLIGIACFIWYNWCYEKAPEDSEDIALSEVGTDSKGGLIDNKGGTYDNDAFKGEKADEEAGNNHEDTNKSEDNEAKSRL